MTTPGRTEQRLTDQTASTANPLRICDGLPALVAVGVLVGLLVWALGPTGPITAPVRTSPPARRAIDFNNPQTLAWSIQLGEPGPEALHDLRCSPDVGQVFICRGISPTGAAAMVRIRVAGDGASWTSQ
jgi:hypothetical protein